MENLFNSLNLKEEVILSLAKHGITIPTEIQKRAIPVALEGKDLIGHSETGTGKTLAFLLPIIESIDLEIKTPQAIILAPTHELVVQIKKDLDSIVKNCESPELTNIHCISLIGDVNIKRHLEKLKEKPQIIVGTTGRILELLEMKKLKCHTVKTIVLDEGDRLLDETNIASVERIIKATLKERQLMLFSATMPDEVIKLCGNFMKEINIIKSGDNVTIAENIEHCYFTCEKRDKILLVRKLMAAIKPAKALLFINNCNDIETLTSKLQFHNLKVDCIHGSLVKNHRRDSLDDLRSGKINLLVTSDLASRGLHIDGISHIFNLDIPEDGKNYLHRVGRTARAGATGTAVSIVTEHEVPLLRRYCTLYGITINPKEVSHGKIFDVDVNSDKKNIVLDKKNIDQNKNPDEKKFYAKVKVKSKASSKSITPTTQKPKPKKNKTNKDKGKRKPTNDMI